MLKLFYSPFENDAYFFWRIRPDGHFEENQRLSRLVDGLERIVMVGVSKMNKFTFTKSSDQVSS